MHALSADLQQEVAELAGARHYVCPSRIESKPCELSAIPSPVVEEKVFGRMAAIGRNRPLIESIVAEADRRFETKTVDDRGKVDGLLVRMTNLDSKISKLVDRLTEEPALSHAEIRAEIARKVEKFSAEKRLLSDEYHSLLARIDLKKQGRHDADLLASILMVPRTYLPMLRPRELKDVMKNIITKALCRLERGRNQDRNRSADRREKPHDADRNPGRRQGSFFVLFGVPDGTKNNTCFRDLRAGNLYFSGRVSIAGSGVNSGITDADQPHSERAH